MNTVFDPWATQYDRTRRQLIPPFDRFYPAVVETLNFASDAPIRVLDLGAGTGLLSAYILERYPNVRLCLQDSSSKMLAVARKRFKTVKSQIVYDFDDYRHNLPGGPFHAVVSALSVHHLAESEKLELFRKLPGILLPGGIFINADQVLGETPEQERFFREAWLADVKAAGISSQDLDAALERMQADRMSTLSVQLEGLRSVGFKNVRCVFQEYSFVVFTGNTIETPGIAVTLTKK